jgi:hypothetical protein
MRRISTTTIVRVMALSSIALTLTNQNYGQSAIAKQTATSGVPVSASKLLGKPAPVFMVATLDGKQVSLSDYSQYGVTGADALIVG